MDLQNDVQIESFNPRSRKGNDGDILGIEEYHDGFNPRSRKGNDAIVDVITAFNWLFQSTFPQGERQDR